MKNNKGQVLVVFVILLPIFLLIFSFIADLGLMMYERTRLNSNNKIVIKYYMYHIETSEEKIKEMLLKNDKNITYSNIEMDDNNIKIELKKVYKTKFSKIIGVKEYKLSSKYRGIIKDKKIKREE